VIGSLSSSRFSFSFPSALIIDWQSPVWPKCCLLLRRIVCRLVSDHHLVALEQPTASVWISTVF
jgi:hypothetical protein